MARTKKNTKKSQPPQSKKKATTKRYAASFYSKPKPIAPSFAGKLQDLEKAIGKRVVLLWHADSGNTFSGLDDLNYLVFAKNIRSLKEQEPVAVVINSPGGSARAAFKLASLLRKHCGDFTVVVPHLAKSAAALFALGAEKIIMSRFAELGPLDAQVIDIEKEERLSALEVVQAIERLNSEAMRAVDQQMLFWLRRSKKKIDTLLPLAAHFVSEMMTPLFDKIDTVNYTGMARILKVAQDYAQRVLEKRGIKSQEAEAIADKLTNAYSEHEYVIDCDELQRIGVTSAEEATGEVATIVENLAFMGSDSVLLGPLEEA